MDDFRVYAKKDLPLRQAVCGAQMWAVALKMSMLTYFELAPGASFPAHSHEAEQITLVLEGELTFRVGDRSFTLGPGEVAAIPSNLAHSVATGSTLCKAVDAWSPPREEYLK